MTDPSAAHPNKVCFSTPWIELLAISPKSGQGAPHYALASKDYVSVVALDEQGRILLVKQYRPAVGQETIELPAGHVEDNQTPEESASQELLDETGYKAGRMELLGVIHPDTGRLMNRHHCFFASNLTRAMSQTAPDEVAEPFAVPLSEFFLLLTQGKFNHAQHLAPLFLAHIHGKLSFPGSPSQDNK